MDTTTSSRGWDSNTVTWDCSTVRTANSSLKDNKVEEVKKGFREKKGVYRELPFWMRGVSLTSRSNVLQEKHSQLRLRSGRDFLLQCKRLSKGSFTRKYQQVRRKRKQRLF